MDKAAMDRATLIQATKQATEQRAAIDLQKDEGWAEAIKVLDDLIKQYEQLALSSSDEKEIIRLAGEARGARKFKDRLLSMLKEMTE